MVCRIGSGPELFFLEGRASGVDVEEIAADRELRWSKVYEQDQDLAAEMSAGGACNPSQMPG